MTLKLRQYRRMREMSQADLARLLGVTQSTLGKYEREESQIPARSLWEASRILRVPVEHFYQEESVEDLRFVHP